MPPTVDLGFLGGRLRPDPTGSLRSFVSALREVDDLSWSDQLDVMRDSFAAVLTGLDIRAFTYQIVWSPTLAQSSAPLDMSLSTYPDQWRDRHAEEGYAGDDPVAVEATRSPLPFSWRRLAESEDLSQRQREFFAIAEAAGVCGSYTIPVHVQGEVAALSVLPNRPDEVPAHSQLLFFIAHYFHLKARRPLIEVTMTLSSRRRSLLSPRETQVLELTAKGKASAEISSRLGISQKSVEFHIESAKRKLQVSNRTHAVAKAIMLGLLALD